MIEEEKEDYYTKLIEEGYSDRQARKIIEDNELLNF